MDSEKWLFYGVLSTLSFLGSGAVFFIYRMIMAGSAMEFLFFFGMAHVSLMLAVLIALVAHSLDYAMVNRRP